MLHWCLCYFIWLCSFTVFNLVEFRDIWIFLLTHCSLVMPYDNIELDSTNTITWTNFEELSSVRSCAIHLRAISQELLEIAIVQMVWKWLFDLILQLTLPGTNELTSVKYFRFCHCMINLLYHLFPACLFVPNCQVAWCCHGDVPSQNTCL